MNLHDIKQISIVDYLQQAGYAPTRIQGIHHWYSSPLRQEQTPSFKVNTERNQWYDFGTGAHGDIIDLVCALQHYSYNEALRQLSSQPLTTIAPSIFWGGKNMPPKASKAMKLMSIRPITHPKLEQYLATRGLNICDVAPFLSEITYSVSEKIYFALGFPNDAGGWELRNPYFKGCLAPKAISTIKRKGKVEQRLQLFEGFMDFLSWRKLHPEVEADSIVLNSLALLPKVLPSLAGYTTIECFLDNDEAGKSAIASIQSAGVLVKDMSDLYAPHKDVNEWLCSFSKEQKQVLHPTGKRGLRR